MGERHIGRLPNQHGGVEPVTGVHTLDQNQQPFSLLAETNH